MKRHLTLALSLLLAIGAMAQSKSVSISASDVQFWTGTGSNSTLVCIGWDDQDASYTPTVVVWGIHWSGTITLQDALDTIVAYDSRFSYSVSSNFINSVAYNDAANGIHLTPSAGWNCNNYNGVYNLTNLSTSTWLRISESTCSDYDFTNVNNLIYASNPNATDPAPVEAIIAPEDILYWVGEGSNEAILAVNWADTALAWGYRWNGTATVADMMDDIATADPRFSYTGTGYLSDILFNDSIVSLAGTPGNYWGSTNNGITDMGMGQTLANGDLEKWGDPAAGVIVDSMEYGGYWYYTYVYPMTIHPVSVPDTTGQAPVEPEHGPFCGAVGTDGCDAIAADSNIIVAWATGCTVNRGPVDITDPDGPRVHFGTDQMGVGPATNSTTNAVSLGDGGTAILTFALPIANGEGPDFAVFENSFNDYFLELAFVEVSSDGERYVRFPATSLTPTDVQVGSNGSVDPTYINNLAGKYRVGFGTPFDLEELRDSTGLDINNITHVRLVDVVGTIDPQYGTYDAFGHLVNDPWPTRDTVWGSGGFDLTGVAVINQNTNGISELQTLNSELSIYPNPAANVLNINAPCATEARLMDISGRTVATVQLHEGTTTFSIDTLPAGIYMLQSGSTVTKVVKL